MSFPVNGYTQTVSAATLATVDFNNTTTPFQLLQLLLRTTISSGAFTINDQNARGEDVSLPAPAISALWTARRHQQPPPLREGSSEWCTAVAAIASVDTMTCDFSALTRSKLRQALLKKVVGDIIGGSNSTFQFSLRRASDASMIDTDLNQPVLATANGSSFSARSSNFCYRSPPGTVSSVKANNSPSSSVSLGATNVKWASFELRAAGEDVKVEKHRQVQANTSLDHGLDNGRSSSMAFGSVSTKDLTDATDVNFTFGFFLHLEG